MYTVEGIVEAAKRNCQLCCRFLSYFESSGGLQNPDLDGSHRAELRYKTNPWHDQPDLPCVHLILFPSFGTIIPDARRGRLELVIAEYKLIDGVLYVYQGNKPSEPHPTRVTTTLTSWTGDEAHLRAITKWMQQCVETHSVCRQEKLQNTGTFIPTRLIDVSTANLLCLRTAAKVSDQKDRR